MALSLENFGSSLPYALMAGIGPVALLLFSSNLKAKETFKERVLASCSNFLYIHKELTVLSFR